MKFHDKGFIYKYKDYTQVQIFNFGVAILDMKIYEDKICKSSFQCQNSKVFNKENLNSSYKSNFLKELFDKEDKQIIHKDRDNGILIKIIKD